MDVYLLLNPPAEANDQTALRHGALRFGKALTDGGAGQIARLEAFVGLIAGPAGGPLP